MAIIDSLNQLETNIANAKQTLVDNMNAKGVSVTTADTLTDIAKKVSDISQGGGDFELAEGTTFAYSRWTEFPEQYKGYLKSCTNLSHMFDNCSNLTSLDLSWLDTSAVTNMSHMFHYCQKLTSPDLSSFDTSNVTDMRNMFTGCSGLTSLDLSSFDTSKVTQMGYIFSYCGNLKCVFGEIDFASMSSTYNGGLFGLSNLNALRQLTVKNLGLQKGYTSTYSFNIPQNWGVNSEEIPNARQSLIDTLITYSFDRAAAGYAPCTITLASNTKAVLSENEIAQITAKGFTIA